MYVDFVNPLRSTQGFYLFSVESIACINYTHRFKAEAKVI